MSAETEIQAKLRGAKEAQAMAQDKRAFRLLHEAVALLANPHYRAK
jgi:hypothetical protein